jgi:hypothetical protein
MPIVSIPDKNMEIEFPDDMSHSDITSAINQHVFGIQPNEPAVMPAKLGRVPPNFGVSTGMKDPSNFRDPFFTNAPLDPAMVQKGAEQLPILGSMLPGPLAVPGAMIGQGIHDVAYPPQGQGVFGTPASQLADLNPMSQNPELEKIGQVPFWNEEFKRLAGAGAMGGAAAVAGPVLGMAGKYLSPQLAGEGTAMALPKFVENPSRLMPYLEQLPFSGGLINKYKSQVGDWIAAERSGIPQDLMGGAIPGNTQAGIALGQAGRDFTQAHSKAYAGFLSQGTEAGAIPVPDAVPLAQQMLNSPDVTKPTAQWLQKIVDNGEMTAADINKALGGKGFGISGEARDPLKQAIMKNLAEYDTAQGTQLSAMRQAGDDLFADYSANWKGNDTLKAVLRQSNQNPQLAVNTMFNRANATELKMLRDTMPEDVWNTSLARYLENKLDSVMPEGVLNTGKLKTMWGEIGPTIKQIEPEVAERMQTFVDTANKGSRSMPILGKQPETKTGLAGVSKGAAEIYGGYKAYEWMEDKMGTPAALGGVVALALIPRGIAWKMLGPPGKRTISRLLGEEAMPTIGKAGAAYGTQQYFNAPVQPNP